MKDLMKTEETVIYTLRELYHRYGYHQFKMSKFEPYDLYMLNKEFLVSDGIITFTDTNGTLMALKPDVTLSIVKNYRKERSSIEKVCYSENVYRIAGTERSYREIMQTGLECLGDVGLYEISEVICLAAESLKAISESFLMDVSHMGIVTQLLTQLQLNEDDTSAALRYLGEKNTDALNELIGAERAQNLVRLMQISGKISDALPALRDICNCPALSDLDKIGQILDQKGLSDHIHLDFSIISDRHYYNDFVFRGYVEGVPAAVLAGGQYDRLMEKMNKHARGIGFAVYLDQLELLNSTPAAYDIDTILLYDENDDPLALAEAASQLSEAGVLLTKELPPRTRCRRLLKFDNGRLITIEDNG